MGKRCVRPYRDSRKQEVHVPVSELPRDPFEDNYLVLWESDGTTSQTMRWFPKDKVSVEQLEVWKAEGRILEPETIKPDDAQVRESQLRMLEAAVSEVKSGGHSLVAIRRTQDMIAWLAGRSDVSLEDRDRLKKVVLSLFEMFKHPCAVESLPPDHNRAGPMYLGKILGKMRPLPKDARIAVSDNLRVTLQRDFDWVRARKSEVIGRRWQEVKPWLELIEFFNRDHLDEKWRRVLDRVNSLDPGEMAHVDPTTNTLTGWGVMDPETGRVQPPRRGAGSLEGLATEFGFADVKALYRDLHRRPRVYYLLFRR